MSLQVTRWYWYGSKVSLLVDRAGEEGVESAGEQLLMDADRHVPYDDGVLKASEDVDTDVDRVGLAATNIEAAASYDTEYAVKLHEHPEFNFQGSGEGKWLEHALQRMSARFEATLGVGLAKVFRLP